MLGIRQYNKTILPTRFVTVVRRLQDVAKQRKNNGKTNTLTPHNIGTE